jgi:hypothetical protein
MVAFFVFIALPQGSRFLSIALARCVPRQKLTTAIVNAGIYQGQFKI